MVGAPRSGTTLVQRMLSVHSRFFSIPEETGLFTAQNIFGRPHFGMTVDDSDALLRRAVDIVDFFDRGVARLEQSWRGVFVEKTPQHVLRIPFLLRFFPAAVFVHVVRDGRDCFCSASTHSDIPQRHSVAGFARYWRRCVRAGRAASADPRVFELRYERLVQDPSGELARLMAFLGEAAEEGQLDARRLADDPRRGHEAFRRLGDPVGDQSCGRWHRELTPAEIGCFERVAGRELCSLGYDVGMPAGHPATAAVSRSLEAS